jgi:hypothetical protein
MVFFVSQARARSAQVVLQENIQSLNQKGL